MDKSFVGTRLACVAGLVFIGVALGANAFAESRAFDIDHLQVSTSGGEFLATEGAGRARPWEFRVATTFRYDDRPLRITGPGAQLLVSGRSLMDLVSSIQLGRYVGLAVDIPVLISQQGTAVTDQAALGDLRIVPRVDLVRRKRFGLTVLTGLRVPTGSTSQFLGEGGVVFEPRLASQLDLGMVHIGLNVGVRVREEKQYLDLRVGNEVMASAALALTPRPYITALLEVHGDTAMSSRFGAAQQSPVEVLLGLNGGAKGVRVGAAVGVGAVSAYGSPRIRALATLEYRIPTRGEPAAQSRTLAKSAPLPRPAVVVASIEASTSGQELAAAVSVPPTPDVTIEDGQIELADPVFFETNHKSIRHRYRDELSQLAELIRARPELGIICIEGHADATGPAAWNLKLSRARADEIARFLLAHEVPAGRLRTAGYGEARPLDPSPAGRPNPKNRRVHFIPSHGTAPELVPDAVHVAQQENVR